MSYSYRVSEVCRYLNQIKKCNNACLLMHLKNIPPIPDNTHRRHLVIYSKLSHQVGLLETKKIFCDPLIDNGGDSRASGYCLVVSTFDVFELKYKS